MANISITNPTILNTETSDVTKLTANDNDLVNGLTDTTKDISINDATLAGEIKVSDGTVSLPSVTFSNDTDTGIYRIGANNMGVACSGTKVMDITTSTIDCGTAELINTNNQKKIITSWNEAPIPFYAAGIARPSASIGYFSYIYNPSRCVYNQLKFSAVSGASGNYDLGIYNLSGTLLTSVGNQTYGALNTALFPITHTITLTMNAGAYMVGFMQEQSNLIKVAQFQDNYGGQTNLPYFGVITSTLPLSSCGMFSSVLLTAATGSTGGYLNVPAIGIISL